MLSFVSSRVPSSQVEDIVQETFVKAFVNLKQHRNPERFKPWLFAICRSMIASRTGELKTSREIPLDEISLRAPEEEEIRLSFPLPPGHRELNLRYKCGFSYREIAALKGISETLVKSRIHESRKKLKKTREPSQLTLEEKIMEKTGFYEKGARIIASLSLPHQLKLIGRARDNGKYDEELLKAFASLPGGKDFVLESEGKLSLSEAAGMICLVSPERSSRIIENIVEEGGNPWNSAFPAILTTIM